jgi:parallel beta-helix repeat protein
MNRKLVLALALALLIGMLNVAFNIQRAKASETIYIRADGSVDPSTANIISADNVTYYFTNNIYDEIRVERGNIIINGNGYTLQGNGSGSGFILSDANNVTIENTNIEGFHFCICFYSSSNNIITKNNITNNYYGIMPYASSSNNITKNNITNNSYGIMPYASSSNNITKNNITNNSYGIYLYYSSNNNITENDMAGNTHGIYLDHSSNNTIFRNNVTENGWLGIELDYSSNNNIIGNDIAGNDWYGIDLDHSSNNAIYHNNFVDNSEQVYSYDSANVWDDGVEGNYWSDYNGTDSDNDGIGDSPYEIDENNADHFPLMGEFHKYHIWYIEPGFTLTLISNSTISNFVVWFWIEHPEYRIIDFNVAGETGYGFCRLCIPKNLMAPPYTVTIDNGQTPVTYYNETLFDNSTHRWIYFAYLHSEHQVEIIPEFPSFLILPLFMIATVLAVMVYRKKHNS